MLQTICLDSRKSGLSIISIDKYISFNMTRFKQVIVIVLAIEFLSVCLSFELLAEKQCVPYSSCNEIIWLQENQEVQTHLDLNGVNCGYERGTCIINSLEQFRGWARINHCLFFPLV